jgi:hypothetical protein
MAALEHDSARETSPEAHWDAAIARWSAAHHLMEATKGDKEGEEFVRIENEIMGIPSPHPRALRWKIQRLREDANQFASEQDVYDFLIADLNRMLGDA